MNEITLQLTTEQFALMQKMLEPYVVLAATINTQYGAQATMQTMQKLDPKKEDELNEIVARG